MALTFLGSYSVALADEAKPTVAVMDFGAENTSSGEASVVSEFVRQAVIRSGKFRVVEKKNQEKILSEQAFQQTGCTSADCAVKLGKLLSARKMIVGQFSAIGGVRFLTASLVDVETGEVEQTGRVRGFEPATADLAADQLVSQLTGVRVSVDGGGSGARPPRSHTRLGIGVSGWPVGYSDGGGLPPSNTVWKYALSFSLRVPVWKDRVGVGVDAMGAMRNIFDQPAELAGEGMGYIVFGLTPWWAVKVGVGGESYYELYGAWQPDTQGIKPVLYGGVEWFLNDHFMLEVGVASSNSPGYTRQYMNVSSPGTPVQESYVSTAHRSYTSTTYGGGLKYFF